MLKFLQFLPVGGPCLTPHFAQLRNFLFFIFSAMHDFGEILNRSGSFDSFLFIFLILLNYHRGNPPFFLTKYWYIVDDKYVQINTDKEAINHVAKLCHTSQDLEQKGRQHFPN